MTRSVDFQRVATPAVIRTVAASAVAILIIGGFALLAAPTVHTDPPDLCQQQLGDKVVTVPCGTCDDILAEPGMGGNVACPASPAASVPGQLSQAEQHYLDDLDQYVHPRVAPPTLLELGNLACSVRRSGMSSDDAREAVWQNLSDAGVVSSNAETGTLVHVAVDNLCPEVGYP